MSIAPTEHAEHAESAVRESFLRFHDAYLEAWRDGLERGDTTAIEPHYRHLRSVQYARPEWDALEPVSTDTTIEGVRQTVAALTGYRQTIADRAVFVRSDREVVVFFRKTIENDERRYVAFMLQVWTKPEASGDDAWTLVRETVEK